MGRGAGTVAPADGDPLRLRTAACTGKATGKCFAKVWAVIT